MLREDRCLFGFLLAMVFASIIATSKNDINPLTEIEHKTQAASEKKNDLWCYQCDTIGEGDMCFNLNSTMGNNTSLARKCHEDKRTCMVKRFSYTTSTENSTSVPMIWGVERNCTNKCEPGCIIIGERTKLYACTTCCEESFCNSGTGKAASPAHMNKKFEFLLALSLQILLTFTLYPS